MPSKDFEIGQLSLLLHNKFQVRYEKMNRMYGHFACLNESDTFELTWNSRNYLKKIGQDWDCRCVYPPPKDDMLIYLTLTGGLTYRPFCQPLCEIVSSALRPTIWFTNSNQPTKTGQPPGTLVTEAIVLASHAEGFGGATFPTFLCRLLYELGVRKQDEMIRLPSHLETSKWGSQVVPFLSPPNVEWPEYLLDDNLMRFENFVQRLVKNAMSFGQRPSCSPVSAKTRSGRCVSTRSKIFSSVYPPNLYCTWW